MVRSKSSHGWVGAWHVWSRLDGALPVNGADWLHVTVALDGDRVAAGGRGTSKKACIDPKITPPWATTTMFLPSWSATAWRNALFTRAMNVTRLSPPGDITVSGSARMSMSPYFAR